MLFIEFVQYTDSNYIHIHVCCLLNLYSTLTLTIYMYVVY